MNQEVQENAALPQRILVTGGCGFIGSALVRHLVGVRRVHVLNVDKLTYAGDPATVEAVAADPRYAFAQIDICDVKALSTALDAFAPDAVVHLAAESHVDRSLDAPAAFVTTNVVGTFSVLESSLRYWQGLDKARRDKFRLLHVSTDEVYGALTLDDPARFTETSRYAPTSPYAASKAAGDHLARAWWSSFGLPVIVSNCSNNYGPYQFPDKLIPRMIISALGGSRLPVYGNGLNVRDWLHVEDHVQALELILTQGRPGESYLVGGGGERANIDLVHSLCAILDDIAPMSGGGRHRDLIAFVEDRPGHDLRYAVDGTRLRNELGWQPRYDFNEGLRATVSWYLENRSWWEKLQSRYAGDRLGLGVMRARLSD